MDKRVLQKIGAVGLILFLVASGCGIMPVVNATTTESQSEPQTKSDATPTVTSVQVTPGNVSMARGNTYEFSVTVSGNNNPNTTVSWAIAGAKSSGTTISSAGVLKVSAEETASSLTVTAISNQNSSVQGKAQVTLTGGNHTVTLKASPSSGGSVSGGGSVSMNGSCTVTASANSGYLFTGWDLDGNTVSTSNTYTVSNITTDKVLVANFKKSNVKVTLAVDHSQRGTVTGGGTIAYGGSMSLRATPNEGYTFKNWTENGKSISTDKNMTLKNITSDRTITANFESSDFDVYLSCNPKDAGTLTGAGNYDAGKDIKVTAKAKDGYTFVSWTNENKIVGYKESYTIDDIDEDTTLVANFKKQEAKTYTIEAATANDGGTISPSGKKSVTEGSTVIYTFIPKDGYRILAVAVDDQQVGTNNSYTFENVKASHSIVVAFTKKESTDTTTPSTTVTPNTQTTTGTTVNPNTQATTGVTADVESSTTIQSTSKPSTQSKTDTQSNQASNQNSSTKPGNTTESSEHSNKAGTNNTEQTTESTTEAGMEQQTAENQVETIPETGILHKLNMTESDAKEMIESGQDRDLIRTACNQDYVLVNVSNDYASENQLSANPSTEEEISVSNFYDVIQVSFTEDEKMTAFKGSPISLNVSITQASQTISQKDQSAIDQAAQKNQGMTVGQYFDVTVNKTVQGQTEQVTELSKEMEVVLQVPTELKGKNREYCVIRSHQNADGSATVSVIKDRDTNANTITFRSDKFSAYAIAYVQQNGLSNGQKQILMVVIFMVSLTIMITIAYTLANYIAQRKYRR